MQQIGFVLGGRRYELSRAQVAARLSGVEPEPVHKHAVLVEGTWFPVMQAFEVAVGVPRSEFISHTARRHLVALGFEVRGEITTRHAATEPSGVSAEEEWHTEANVQAIVVTALATAGWKIRSVADTATRERGVDVIAERAGVTVGIEVKGFPSRAYADPSRAAETKPTAPSTQAGHWFAHAILAAMRLRNREPSWRTVIALPDFPRYRTLHAEVTASLDAARIEIWWIHENGTISLPSST